MEETFLKNQKIHVEDVPPLQETFGKPGKALIFRDNDTKKQTVCIVGEDLADELAQALAKKKSVIEMPTPEQVLRSANGKR